MNRVSFNHLIETPGSVRDTRSAYVKKLSIRRIDQ